MKTARMLDLVAELERQVDNAVHDLAGLTPSDAVGRLERAGDLIGELEGLIREEHFAPAYAAAGARPLYGRSPRCCGRAGEYNGFGSDGPTLFTCPGHCSCHD